LAATTQVLVTQTQQKSMSWAIPASGGQKSALLIIERDNNERWRPNSECKSNKSKNKSNTITMAAQAGMC
jgi:hypothetical protein